MADNFFTVLTDKQFPTKQKTYQFLSSEIARTSGLDENIIFEKLSKRESLGNIQIADKTILPHFESENIDSRVIILKLLEEIPSWSKDIANVQLVITIVLSEEATVTEKQRIKRFIQKLSSDDYIAQLLVQEKLEIEENLEV